MRYLPFFLITISVVLATDVCSVSGVGSGLCLSSSSCSEKGGKAFSGYCSGGSDVQCCVNIPCGNNKGTCMRSSECLGTTTSDDCSGPNGFSCCVSSESKNPVSGSASKIVSAAESMVGKYVYSWDAGDIHGATKGAKEPESPYCDDRKVVGFDCSGLAIYSVYQGTGKSLPHRAQDQYSNAPKYDYSERQPGDLVFFGKSTSSIKHVAIYVGGDKMVEAPGHDKKCHGLYVRKVSVPSTNRIKKVGRFY